MIDEYSRDGTGWARFSDDRKNRYRLARALTEPGRIWITKRGHSEVSGVIMRVVFVMLNPSTADAWKPDRTIARCVRFAQIWGGDVLEVVNLHAFISAYPAELKKLVGEPRSEIGQATNNAEIVAACLPATRIIAAWGTDGSLDGRDKTVCNLLKEWSVPAQLETLGLTGDGFPTHPQARGKHFVPYDRQPVPFTPVFT